MDRVEGIERDRTGDRLSEGFNVTERVSEAGTDRGNDCSPPTLEIDPSTEISYTPLWSPARIPLFNHITSHSLPPPLPHTMDTSNVRFRPVPVTVQAEMTSTYNGHPRQIWPVMVRWNRLSSFYRLFLVIYPIFIIYR